MGDAVRAITLGPREWRWMRQARVSPRGSFRKHNDMCGAIVGDIAGSVYEWNPITGAGSSSRGSREASRDMSPHRPFRPTAVPGAPARSPGMSSGATGAAAHGCHA